MSREFINQSRQIDEAEVIQTGYEARTVRMLYEGKEIGFATTTYSFHLTTEMRGYAAERIALLLKLATGLTNDQIAKCLASLESVSNQER